MAPSSGLASGLADSDFHRFATRDVDWEAVRRRLEVYPEEQRLTMYLLGAFTGVVAASESSLLVGRRAKYAADHKLVDTHRELA